MILAGEFLVLRDQVPAVGDVQPAAAPGDLDRLADEREGHRVAIGLEADEVILRHEPRLAGLEAKARLAAGGNQVEALLREAIDRALVGRAVDPDIGNLGLPLAELLAQILFVDEGAAGQEIALEVLHVSGHPILSHRGRGS